MCDHYCIAYCILTTAPLKKFYVLLLSFLSVLPVFSSIFSFADFSLAFPLVACKVERLRNIERNICLEV